MALLADAHGAGGGIAQFNRDFLEALSLSDQVESIHCMVRPGPATDHAKNIIQSTVASNNISYSVKAVQRSIRTSPDVLFCGHIDFLPLAVLIGKLTHAKTWLNIHGIDAWEIPSNIIARLVSNVTLVTCVSRYTRKRFLQWSDIDPAKVKVLPNTIGLKKEHAEPTSICDELGLQGKKILLTVGRLASSEQYKGHDRVLSCLPDLVSQQPNIHYLVAGDGGDVPRLQQLAARLNVQDHVSFLGKVESKRIDRLYQTADLFVMPSTGEGFGIVFLEAMAHGTPALGLNEDGSNDPLQDGALGIVASEATLCADIMKALNAEPDSTLASRTQQLFGKKNYNQHVDSLLMEAVGCFTF